MKLALDIIAVAFGIVGLISIGQARAATKAGNSEKAGTWHTATTVALVVMVAAVVWRSFIG